MIALDLVPQASWKRKNRGFFVREEDMEGREALGKDWPGQLLLATVDAERDATRG